MINEKTRATLLGVAACYLLYISYELFQSRGDPNTSMTPLARTLFIALFVLSAAGLLVYAYLTWKRSGKTEEAPPPEDERNSQK